jgi:membrane fusion protein, heavy metal efflux system
MKRIFMPLALMAILLFACGEHSHSDHSHGQASPDELEGLAYTLYTQKTELFVEFKPLIVGTETKFAAHFTKLGETFKAMDEGLITLTLIVNGKSTAVQADHPEVPGIFRLRLSPEQSGKGKLVFSIKCKDYEDEIAIDEVEVFTDLESAKKANPSGESSANDITYLKEQAWKVDFANTAVIRGTFHEVIRTNGQVMSSPNDEAVVTAKTSGIVRFPDNTPLVGKSVTNGTVLFQITGGSLSEGNIDAVYSKAKVNFDKAKSDYERASALVAEKIISQKDFLVAKNSFETAQIELNTISKNYTGSGQNIFSSADGYIREVYVNQGQFVEVGTPLALISGTRNLVLQANVSQRYADRIAEISSATFKVSSNASYLDTDSLGGKVISYGKSLNISSPFIPIIFQINNPGDLLPGAMAEIMLKSRNIESALIIPMSSLIEEQGMFFVYVQTEGETFQKREVKVGSNDGINTQVLSGVLEGERVVSKGAYQIKLSSASGTLPAHGHEH